MRNGIADSDPVPAGVLRAFSRRRAEIAAELERRGATSAGAAQVAALATRRAKDYRVTPEQLVPEWRRRARELGLDQELVRALLGREQGVPLPRLETLGERLAARDGLTARRSTFTRREVVQALCELLPAGSDATVADVERLADAFLGSSRAVPVIAADGSDAADAAAKRLAGVRDRDATLLAARRVRPADERVERLRPERRRDLRRGIGR